MSEADPNPFPEFKLFGSERLRGYVDVVLSIGHLILDQVRRDPKPFESDHFKPAHEIRDGAHIHRIRQRTFEELSPAQQRAREWLAKLDMVDPE